MLGLTPKWINTELVLLRLKEIRNELNMTMRDLAIKFNTTSSSIRNYENNKYLILSIFLIELCIYSVDWALGRSENKYV